MNVFILILLLLVILIVAFIVNRYEFLSVTFISVSSYLLVSITYLVGISNFGKDISFETVFIICIVLISMLCGEFLGRNIKLKGVHREKQIAVGGYFRVSKQRTFLIFVIMCITAVYEFLNLYSFSLTNGNNVGLSGVMESTRLLVATGKYNTGNIVIVALNIISEICVNIYLYFFLHNILIYKKIEKFLLLPVVGYCLIVVSFTSRTPYITIVSIIISLLLIFSYKTSKNRSYKNKKIIKKVLVLGGLLLIFFFLYGNFTRNIKIGLFDQVLSYIGAPLYGLNSYLEKPWDKNPTFGYYTLQEIRSFFNNFGTDFLVPYSRHLKFFSYQNGRSNIYTSLVLQIQDYGIVGCCIIRFVIGFFLGKVLTVISKIKNTSRYAVVFTVFFVNVIFSCYFDGIADKYFDILLQPTALLKYTLGTWIVLKFICKYTIAKGEKEEITRLNT